ncbi:protein PelC [Pseudoalteromonas sp. B131b]|uniref:protein PelC n=1 Tax=unclassified Pseudoalteromonas TaxID=194690 RepID=UPI000BBEBB60|nr:protein PelC [Pseudoalteromonas sp. 1_2015MBL_MicDiv]ATG78340.1 protein PelC [Pseudoalteromonas sp. 1_2015MBL_MicDiv]
MFRLVIPCLVLLLSACTTSRVTDDVEINPSTTVALLPLVNHAQTPLAGERAEDILTSIWQQNKLPTLLRAPRNSNKELPPLDDQYRLDNAMQWLSTQQADYLLTGSIEEWRYKAGLDGEPVVALTLSLTANGQTTPIWTGTIAKSGWGRDSIAATAQDVIADLISYIEVSE